MPAWLHLPHESRIILVLQLVVALPKMPKRRLPKGNDALAHWLPERSSGWDTNL